MGTIERVKEWVQKNGIPFEVDFGEGDHDEEFIRSVDILDVLASIETERCVWAWDNDGFYHTSCGKAWQFSDDRKGIGDFHTCPFKGCGKRIEVREEGNG